MKEKILVVDDDKSMVNMIKDVLEMEGYHPTNYSGVPVISLYASCMGACAASMFFMGTFCFTATNLMRNIGLAIGLLFFFWLLLTSTIIRVLPEILQLFKLHLVNQQPDFNKKRWCKHGNKSM